MLELSTLLHQKAHKVGVSQCISWRSLFPCSVWQISPEQTVSVTLSTSSFCPLSYYLTGFFQNIAASMDQCEKVLFEVIFLRCSFTRERWVESEVWNVAVKLKLILSCMNVIILFPHLNKLRLSCMSTTQNKCTNGLPTGLWVQHLFVCSPRCCVH